jgi:hypothetical protein
VTEKRSDASDVGAAAPVELKDGSKVSISVPCGGYAYLAFVKVGLWLEFHLTTEKNTSITPNPYLYAYVGDVTGPTTDPTAYPNITRFSLVNFSAPSSVTNYFPDQLIDWAPLQRGVVKGVSVISGPCPTASSAGGAATVMFNGTLTCHTASPCVNDCWASVDRGSCNKNSGICSCDENFELPDCSTQRLLLVPGTANNGTLDLTRYVPIHVEQPLPGPGSLSAYAPYVTAQAESDANYSNVAFTFSFGDDESDEYVWPPMWLDTVPTIGQVSGVGGDDDDDTPACADLMVIMARGRYPSLLSYEQAAYLCVNETAAVTGNVLNVPHFVGPSDTLYHLAIIPLTNASLVPMHVSVDFDLACPNDCSGNGVCSLINGTSASACKCDAHWDAAVDCSVYLEDLTSGEPVSGAVEVGGWRYYRIYVALEDNFLLIQANLTSTQNSTSVSVFASAASYPDLLSYSIRSPQASVMNEMHVTGFNLLAGYWIVGIFGAEGTADHPFANYTVSASSLSVCPSPCSEHGQCIGGKCQCDAGFVGDDCSAEFTYLPPQLTFRGSVSFNKWSYYTVRVFGQNALSITVNESNPQFAQHGLVWVYARRVTPDCAVSAGRCLPTPNSYTYLNDSLTAVHELYIPSITANGTWQIGITGGPAEHGRVNVDYVIEATVGCSGYHVCHFCVEDPNCGWCADDARTGKCIAGGPDSPYVGMGACPVWYFDECRQGDHKKSQALGITIGIVVGFVVVFIISGAFITVWYRESRASQMGPVSSLEVSSVNVHRAMGGARAPMVVIDDEPGAVMDDEALMVSVPASGPMPDVLPDSDREDDVDRVPTSTVAAPFGFEADPGISRRRGRTGGVGKNRNSALEEFERRTGEESSSTVEGSGVSSFFDR